ncbi:Rotavirus_VP4 helical domain-containing protein [Hexamita inflata]|uniref:Rotavirus VP4 helical domain-containing protein n=1 Tax=Hexamita inflata TaxID=28002 RepID=A0AA86RQ33_9EUKA|nr:Rotavirus VP4 helical domain-containing protein [Hexamita inflata]CAI9971271.1 Rotavirus VP4 helical domain-containing protein [Hexamita inflata]CAI9976022.1 Rotavirus VP4 helical domain-containing protein [Hexamita inflata]
MDGDKNDQKAQAAKQEKLNQLNEKFSQLAAQIEAIQNVDDAMKIYDMQCDMIKKLKSKIDALEDNIVVKIPKQLKVMYENQCGLQQKIDQRKQQ